MNFSNAESYQSTSSSILSSVMTDDAVSIAIKTLCQRWTITIYLWLISFILVMIQNIYWATFYIPPIILFIPMWIGSLFAIISIAIVLYDICSNDSRLISPEQRLFLRAQGSMQSSLYIDYESLPILRRLFFWGIVSAIFALMAAITQMLFYFWLVDGIIGMWNALIPVLLMVLLLVGYMFAMATISLHTSLIASLLVVAMALFAVKISGEIQALPWIVVVIPILIIQVSWLWHIIHVVYRAANREIFIDFYQRCCIALYTSSIILGVLAELVTVEAGNGISAFLVLFNQLCWVFGVVCFVVAGTFMINKEGDLLANSRGFTDPLPLSLTEAGWMASTEARSFVSILLGTIMLNRSQYAYELSDSIYRSEVEKISSKQ